MNTSAPFTSRHLTSTAAARTEVLGSVLALLCLLPLCRGQGTITVAFEGQPPGTLSASASYSESGMQFWNAGPETLLRVGSGVSAFSDNGTAYLIGGHTLDFAFSPYAAFDLLSLDIAEGSTQFQGPVSLHVVGYISGGQGSTVTTDLTTDGINDGPGGLQDFQTFTFDNRFQNIYRVEILSGGFALDNVLISGVPEPSAGVLVLLGAACAFGRPWIKRRSP